MQSDYVGEVRRFVVANYLLGREDGFRNDDSFLEQGIIDSTGILELISHLEATYEIEVTDDELSPDNLDSFNKISEYLIRKLVVPAPGAESETSNVAPAVAVAQ
jgi:acyl carrier protein